MHTKRRLITREIIVRTAVDMSEGFIASAIQKPIHLSARSFGPVRVPGGAVRCRVCRVRRVDGIPTNLA